VLIEIIVNENRNWFAAYTLQVIDYDVLFCVINRCTIILYDFWFVQKTKSPKVRLYYILFVDILLLYYRRDGGELYTDTCSNQGLSVIGSLSRIAEHLSDTNLCASLSPKSVCERVTTAAAVSSFITLYIHALYS